MAAKFKIENAILLNFEKHAWGNRKQGNLDAVETEADKAMLTLTKKLIDSKEYTAIIRHMNDTKKWLRKRSAPWAMKSVFMFKYEMVDEVERYFDERVEGMKPLVRTLVEVLPAKIKAAESALKPEQFNRLDYPSPEAVGASFAMEKAWVSYGVPRELPEDVYKREEQAAIQRMEETAEKVTMGMRAAFRGMLDHLVERLTPAANGAKPKILRDAVLDNIDEFMTLYQTRNFTNDVELAKLVEKAEKVLSNSFYGIKDLKSDKSEQEFVKKNIAAIKVQLDGMIVDKPGRRLWDDED